VTHPSLARSERAALCDLALELGEDAPTLCGDWDAKDLVVHLLVRERSLVGAPGITLPPLARLTDLEMARVGRGDFAQLVDRLRSTRLTLMAIPLVDRLINTLEFFVHHEDLRRAQPGWTPRELPEPVQSALWQAIGTAGKALVRPAGVAVTLGNRTTGETAVLRHGKDPVVVTGEPAELVLFLYGRAEVHDLDFSGPRGSVARLTRAKLGV
jgi:uncharacterized protein (TIGR03085 family)